MIVSCDHKYHNLKPEHITGQKPIPIGSMYRIFTCILPGKNQTSPMRHVELCQITLETNMDISLIGFRTSKDSHHQQKTKMCLQG